MHESYKFWLEQRSPKIFCQCPCHQEIIIQKHHKYYGIPKYILGHHNRGKSIPQHQRLILSEQMKVDNPSKRQEVKDKISKSRTGIYILDKCPAWRGGKSFEPYCIKWTKEKREEIREQYGRKCYICNKDEKDNITKTGKQFKLSVHHIDEDKEQGCNGKQWKLVPLCLKCHIKVRKNKIEVKK